MAAARVLIVDDEELILTFTSRLLRSVGYEVLGTTSPREAVEIVKNESPIDVIVSDIDMPEMPGTELVREVVSISPRIARILISGAPVESTKIPEGVPVLRKPFVTAELISAVQAVLGCSAQLSDDLVPGEPKIGRTEAPPRHRLQFEPGAAVLETRGLLSRPKGLNEAD